jgi:hypothetical protein
MPLLKTVHAPASSFIAKSEKCAPVSAISRLIGAAIIFFFSTAATVSAQQLRAPDANAKAREGLTRFEPPTMLPELASGENNAEPDPRRNRRNWIKSANGSLSVESVSARAREGGRMSGLSREERHRLRSDIREAGFTVYSPGSGQGLVPIQAETGPPVNYPPPRR